ncbi:MAG: CHAT domain-containing protein [Candidatus Electrothrix sp. ATG1]|nr:CHAT domain-containing protein [Candidatus Electrothrix sp. ATG1]
MKRTILFLAAAPRDDEPLQLSTELREIKEALQLSSRRNDFNLIDTVAVRVQDLRRALLAHEPQIVHFSGHGTTTACILENQAGNTHPVENEAIATLFGFFVDCIQCVVLNSCNSEALAEKIAGAIPYVVGMNDEIDDESAIHFSTGFYDALGAGKNYEAAFKIACNAIALANLPGKDFPVLKKGNPEAIQKSFPPASAQNTVPDQQQNASQFNTLLTENIATGLKEISQLHYAGKLKTALDQLLTIKQDQVRWSAQENKKKAQVLRIEANLLLNYSNKIDLAQQRSD